MKNLRFVHVYNVSIHRKYFINRLKIGINYGKAYFFVEIQKILRLKTLTKESNLYFANYSFEYLYLKKNVTMKIQNFE